MKRNIFYLLISFSMLILGGVVFLCYDTSLLTTLRYLTGWILVMFFFACFTFFTAFVSIIAKKTWEPLLHIGKKDNDANSGLYMTGVAAISFTILIVVLFNGISGKLYPEIQENNVLKYINSTQDKIEFIGVCMTIESASEFQEKHKLLMNSKYFMPAKTTVIKSMINDPNAIVELIKKYNNYSSNVINPTIIDLVDILIENNYSNQINELLRNSILLEKLTPYATDINILRKQIRSSKPYITPIIKELSEKRLKVIEKES